MENNSTQRENTGVLFPNKKKTSPNHPDYTGKLNTDGKDYYMSAWLKKSKSNTNFITIAIRDYNKLPETEVEYNKNDNNDKW